MINKIKKQLTFKAFKTDLVTTRRLVMIFQYLKKIIKI